MSTTFSNIFSQLRRERGLSQRQVAADLDISQALLSHYENGLREPRIEFIVKVCEYYGVSSDYLFGRTKLRYDPGAISAGLDDQDVLKLERALSIAVALTERGRAQGADAAERYFELAAYKAFLFADDLDGEAEELGIDKETLLKICDVLQLRAEAQMGCIEKAGDIADGSTSDEAISGLAKRLKPEIEKELGLFNISDKGASR